MDKLGIRESSYISRRLENLLRKFMVLVKKERESNFELLRLIAMIFIVLYHFCSSVKAGIDTENRWILLGYTNISHRCSCIYSNFWVLDYKTFNKKINFFLFVLFFMVLNVLWNISIIFR